MRQRNTVLGRISTGGLLLDLWTEIRKDTRELLQKPFDDLWAEVREVLDLVLDDLAMDLQSRTLDEHENEVQIEQKQRLMDNVMRLQETHKQILSTVVAPK